MTYSTFEDLPIWQESRSFLKRVFLLIDSNSKINRNYSLADQLRRSATSVLLNISEGFERGSNLEFAHFLNISKGSAGEVRSILYVLFDIGYISQKEFTELHATIQDISKHIANFRTFLLKNKGRKK